MVISTSKQSVFVGIVSEGCVEYKCLSQGPLPSTSTGVVSAALACVDVVASVAFVDVVPSLTCVDVVPLLACVDVVSLLACVDVVSLLECVDVVSLLACVDVVPSFVHVDVVPSFIHVDVVSANSWREVIPKYSQLLSGKFQFTPAPAVTAKTS